MSAVLQKEELKVKPLYEIVTPIPNSVIATKNKAKSWVYGYNAQYDIVVISRDGTIGDIYCINSLNIALPATPNAKNIESRSKKKEEQYWEPKEQPPQLFKIKTIFQWNKKPMEFKLKWVDYIENEFDRREQGHWFMNNGIPTYMTGSHYMYVQWTVIDIGLPDYREANRIFYIYWEACKADNRCYGINYLKIRRSGFSFMASEEGPNIATINKKARVGILSKTGADAKTLFTDKLVPVVVNYPFFFKPIQDGMDKPKTELAFRVPASKITKNNMYDDHDEEEDDVKGLDSSIDWLNTGNNSYDSQKLLLLIHDESGKWIRPNNILSNWRVTKTCLRLGKKIVGKCMMGSTPNALDEGGENYKKLYTESNPRERNKNGQTKSGLYALYIPMEHNMEGFIDRYGMPVFFTPEEPIMGIDGEWIEQGAVDYWENERDSNKGDADALNEFYRQYSRTEAHAFRDKSENSLFNLTRIYQQVDYNDNLIKDRVVVRGNLSWFDNKRDEGRVVWTPSDTGKFYTSWRPNAQQMNKVIKQNGLWVPLNEHFGIFGCDSYDISGVVGGGGSNGALSGLTKFHMDEKVPVNEFFLEYATRPPTAEIFFDDVIKALVFFGMPVLAENNKPRLLYEMKNRGYRKFSINRPDKPFSQLSKTEREIGGIPNSSDSVKMAHAEAIEYYIDRFVGIDEEGTYRDSDMMGSMPFNRTLLDWSRFDITNRTKYDLSISSGLAIMGTLKNLYRPVKTDTKISINFARYNNSGLHSEIIE